jgi:phosphonatase-like hydrolase
VNELELVIFDLAGTTVQDRGQVPLAFSAALAEHGMNVTGEQINNVRGASKRLALLHFIPEGPEQMRLVEEVYSAFRSHLMQQYASAGVHPIPGAAETFAWLRERDVHIALNTGFDRETTRLLLEALGWSSGMVDAVVCGDDVTKGRPAPYLIFQAMELTRVSNVHKVANVGDTILDLGAGHNAGVRWNVGVLSGAHDRRKLEGAPHTHIISSVAELPNIWKIE